MTDAADELYLSQPAVSLQIRALEEELDCVLFERHGPRISLTREGQELYEMARPLVEGLDSLHARFDRLVAKNMSDYFPRRSYGVVMRRGKYLKPQAQAFLEACEDFPCPTAPGGRGIQSDDVELGSKQSMRHDVGPGQALRAFRDDDSL